MQGADVRILPNVTIISTCGLLTNCLRTADNNVLKIVKNTSKNVTNREQRTTLR